MATEFYTSTFPNSATGTATEAQWELYTTANARDGIIKNQLNEYLVYGDSSGMQVKVKSGFAMLSGIGGHNAAEGTLTLAAAHATLNRIDRIVLHLDKTSPAQMSVKVVQGTNSATPSAPALTNTSTIVEKSLAYVYVGAAVSTIAADVVVDERLFSYPLSREILYDVTLASAYNTFYLGDIPQTYRNLVVEWSLRTTGGSAAQWLTMLCNGDTGANYKGIITAAEVGAGAMTFFNITGDTNAKIGGVPGTGFTTDVFASGRAVIRDYASAHANKHISSHGMTTSGTSATGGCFTELDWFDTDPITALTLISASSTDFAVGSRVSIYGEY
jgi:hypothetical protein